MRHAIILVVGIMFLCALCAAQGVNYIGSPVLTSNGSAVANPTIRICTEPATGSPCTALASIYTDKAETLPLANPFTGDALGNYNFYASPGLYHIQITGNGISQFDIANVLLNTGPISNGVATQNAYYTAATTIGSDADLTYTAVSHLHTFGSGGINSPGLVGLTAPLTPNAAGGTTLGSAALPFSSIYLGAAGTNNIQVTGTATGARAATLPDNTGTVAELNLVQSWTVTQNFQAITATSLTGLTGTLTPNAAGGIAIGSASLPFSSVYIGGAATNNAQVTGTFTGARVMTIPDVTSDTFQMLAAVQNVSSKTMDTTACGAAPCGDVIKIAGTSLTATTGSGAVVLATNAVMTTPNIGAATFTTLTSSTASPAGSGALRLATGDLIAWKNAAGGGDVTLGDAGAAAAGTGNLADLLLHAAGYQGAAFVDASAAPAQSGVLRTGNATTAVAARNQAGGGDLALLGSNSSNQATLPTIIAQVNTANPVQYNGITQTVRVTGDFTQAANTNLQNITGLSWTMPANTALNIAFNCNILYSQGAAAVSSQFGIQDVTIAPSNIMGGAGVYTNTTAVAEGNLPTLTTTTATPIITFTPGASATVFIANIFGVVEQPSNPSSSAVNIMVQTSNSSDLITIKKGSYCQLQQVN